MKKLLIISLVILLGVSLGITIAPIQSVKASHEHTKGITFNIKARGEGSYQFFTPSSEQGSGEFYIGFAGSGFSPNPYYRGLAFRSSAGKVKGSFGTHEVDVNIHVWPMNDYYCKYDWGKKTLELYGISVMGGSYDGQKVTNGWGQFGILSPASESITFQLTVETDAGLSWFNLTIDKASADMFKIDIREIGY